MFELPFVLICLSLTVMFSTVGCGPKTDDSADTEIAQSPYEMPYYGECSRNIAFDRQDDGSVDYTKLWEWDAEERLSSYEYDDVEGPFEERDYGYDEAGCWTDYQRYTIQSDGDVETFTAQMTCDEQGTRATETIVEVFGDPEDPDDTWTWIYTYTNTYDAGLLVQQDTHWTFESPEYGVYEGSFSELMSYEGELKVYEETWVDDEQTRAETWEWDTDENLLRYEELDLDDDEDYLEEHGYDAHGRHVSERQSSDSDDLLVLNTMAWDETAFRYLEQTMDDGEDGVLEGVWTYSCAGDWPWTCDVAYEVEDEDAGTSVDGTTDHTYTDWFGCP